MNILDRTARMLAKCIAVPVLGISAAAAAQTYPTAMIKVIVPFGPGGAAQALAERVGASVSENIGQPLVHDYRGGAAGLIAADAAAKSTANGYTVFMGVPSALIVAPLVMKSKTHFDPEKAFIPIAGIAATPFVIFVNASLPIKNLKDLIEYGKAHPGKLNFGSIGANGTDYIAGQVLQDQAGFKMTNIPYKSVGTLLPDVVAGRVDVAILSPIPIRPFVQEGKLRMLAVTSGERSASPYLKDVPTVAEQGVRDYSIVSWYGYFAPAGTPADAIHRFHDAVEKTLKEKKVSAYLLDQGLSPIRLSVEQFKDYYDSDMRKWTGFVRDTHIPIQ